MSEPKIIVPDTQGLHNKDLEASINRLKKGGTYKDMSTAIIVPTRGMIPATVVQSWCSLIRPMNQKVIGPIFIQGLEVGEAYEAAIDLMLNSFPDFKYMCTLEEDNCPPPDGLLKLYEAIEGEVDGQKYDCVQGIYWTKGEGGQPMLYGDPNVHPRNFIPQVPIPDAIQQVNGLGMGFNLFRMSMFKEGRIERPFFKTVQKWEPGQGAKMYTQDLYFFEKAGAAGYRFASDNRCRVGHWDQAGFQMW